MKIYTLTRQQLIPTSIHAVFAFFSEPRMLARITPPWLHFQLVGPKGPIMGVGLRLTYRIRVLGIPQTWVSEITSYRQSESFVDEQLRGPYALWRHEHTFQSTRDGTLVTDTVTYALPFGVLGRLAHALFVRRQLAAIFDFREATLRTLFSHTRGRASAADVGA